MGLAPRRRLAESDAPRFLADAMLGRLARWLRLLGFDTAYAERLADGELVRRAIEEERWILTRDRSLPQEWRVSGVHVLAAEELVEQLRDVVQTFRLAGRARPFGGVRRHLRPGWRGLGFVNGAPRRGVCRRRTTGGRAFFAHTLPPPLNPASRPSPARAPARRAA